MKNLKIFGLVLAASGVVFTSLAMVYSPLQDIKDGNAFNVVKSRNIVQVYNYPGLSPEATSVWSSTFNEQEDWRRWVWTPAQTEVEQPLSPERRADDQISAQYKDPYVSQIDECLEEGNFWDHQVDICKASLFNYPSQNMELTQKIRTGDYQFGADYKVPYVQQIDNCLEAGKTWDHRVDVCR